MNAIPLINNAPKFRPDVNVNVNHIGGQSFNPVSPQMGNAMRQNPYGNETQLRQEVNTSIVALKREAFSLENLIAQAAQTLQDINNRLAELEGKQGNYVKKSDATVSSVGGSGKYISAISETDGVISATATDLGNMVPVNSVTSGNMHSVSSDAVYSELVDGDSWTYFNTETISGQMWYKIVGKTVFLRINNTGLKFSANGGTMVYQSSGNTIYLPSVIRPQRQINFLMCDNSTDSAIHARLLTDGRIQGWSNPSVDITTITSWQCDYCYRLD